MTGPNRCHPQLPGVFVCLDVRRRYKLNCDWYYNFKLNNLNLCLERPISSENNVFNSIL